MYEKQNKHYAFNVFPECNVRNVIFRFLVYTVGQSWRKSKFVSLRACLFYYGGIANLRKRIRHQMKTCLSLRRINSAACRNHREPQGCCVMHSFTFGFTTRCLQNAMKESNRNKAIQLCLLSYNSEQYFLQISLESSRFFFLEKYQETCVCENRMYKIQTSTGLYKSISVCLMTKKSFRSF